MQKFCNAFVAQTLMLQQVSILEPEIGQKLEYWFVLITTNFNKEAHSFPTPLTRLFELIVFQMKKR